MAIPPVTLRVPVSVNSESACTGRGSWCTSKQATKHRNCHMVKNSDLMKGQHGVIPGEVFHVVGMKRPEASNIYRSTN